MKDKNKNYELYNDLVEVIELKKPEDLNNVKKWILSRWEEISIDLKKKCILEELVISIMN